MCRVLDADSYWQFSTSSNRVARKKHRCDECYRTIEIGEKYNYIFGKFDGQISQWETCQHCQVCKDWLNRECHGYLLGVVKEDLVEHWQEDEIHTRELAHLIWGMRRKWKKRNGDRMEIPKLVERVC